MASSKDSVPTSVPIMPARSHKNPGAAAESAAFVLPLLHGICVGVSIPGGAQVGSAALVDLNPAAHPPSLRDRQYAAGRLALGQALMRLGLAADQLGPLGASERGAPRTPAGTSGSVSHKQEFAVALAAWRRPGPDDWIVGVDIEARKPTTRDIAPRILCADERARLEHLSEHERRLAAVLCFSIKEAIYKAIDPFVTRYVGFREVSLHAHADGRVDVRAMLEPAPPQPLEIQAMWTETHGHYVSAARARLC